MLSNVDWLKSKILLWQKCVIGLNKNSSLRLYKNRRSPQNYILKNGIFKIILCLIIIQSSCEMKLSNSRDTIDNPINYIHFIHFIIIAVPIFTNYFRILKILS